MVGMKLTFVFRLARSETHPAVPDNLTPQLVASFFLDSAGRLLALLLLATLEPCFDP